MKNIFKALANFQNECPVILKDTQGYGYVFADLPAILEVINPLLKKHGLGFTQPLNGSQIKTIVFHVESGESIESLTDIPQGVKLSGMNDFQVLGSAITYLRRYSLSSIFRVATKVSLLILTGKATLNDELTALAKANGVTVISVDVDTYTASNLISLK